MESYYKDESATLYLGDCIAVLKTLPRESVHCCVTSPPYFGLRNYNAEGQIGLEATPQIFVAKIVEVFEEVRRVLRKDGLLFLNLGDSYAGSWGNYVAEGSNSHLTQDKRRKDRYGTFKPAMADRSGESGFKPKDLMLMPHRVAIALQDAGWYVRSDMPWVKRSAMPESVRDRPAKALEYVFMLAKSPKYFFDMQAVRIDRAGDEDSNTFRGDCYVNGDTDNGPMGKRKVVGNKRVAVPGNKTHRSATAYENGATEHRTKVGLVAYAQKARDRSLPNNRNGEGGHLDETPAGGRNFRNSDLWFQSIDGPHGMVGIGDELVGLDVNPAGFKDAHFATFPSKLIEPLIKAGTSEKGCCSACGSPWERQTTDSYTNPGNRSTNGPRSIENRDFTAGFEARLEKQTLTTGWRPTCKCDADVVPCTVLEPFTGSGTTLLTAKRLGRRSIGAELNLDYCRMAVKRLETWYKAPRQEKVLEDLPLFDAGSLEDRI